MPEEARSSITEGIASSAVSTRINIKPPGAKPRAAAGGFGDNSLVNLGDFEVEGEEEEVDFERVYASDAARLTLYCLDHLRKRAIFVEADPDAILASTFIYTGQRQHATRCYAVPYDTLCSMFESKMVAGWESNVCNLYSTGRCGSTLLSKLMDQANTVVSISEPDVYSYITFLLSKDPDCFSSCNLPRLLRAVTWFTYDFAVGLDPGKTAVCLKYRAQVIALAPQLKEAMPGSKNVFLYREGIPTIDSFCKAFLSSAGARWARWLSLDSLFISRLSGWADIFDYLMPYVNKEGAPPATTYLAGGFPSFMTMIWLSVMDSAFQLASEGFFDAIVRYEDLCTHRLTVANKLLGACGFAAHISGDASNVFDEDAHTASTGGLVGSMDSRKSAGVGLAGEGNRNNNKPAYIPESDVGALRALLAHHTKLQAANFVLPYTLEF